MGFQQWDRGFGHGRSQAIVGHARQRRAGQAIHDPDRVNAITRLQLRLPGQIERRETDRATQPPAGNDLALREIRVTEEAVRLRDVARLETLANARAADRAAIVLDARRTQHGHLLFARLGQQQRHVAPPSRAETPVFPHIDAGQARQMAFQIRQEFLRLDPGEFQRERLLDDHVDAQPVQHAKFHLRTHDHPRALRRIEQRARVRPERQHARDATGAARRMDGRFDHGLMAEVDAVVHADRQMQRPREQRDLVESGKL